jgi:hypothetical protein
VEHGEASLKLREGRTLTLDAEIDQDIKILIKKTAATKSKQNTAGPKPRKSLK